MMRTTLVPKVVSSRAQRGTFRDTNQGSLATLGMTPSLSQPLVR